MRIKFIQKLIDKFRNKKSKMINSKLVVLEQKLNHIIELQDKQSNFLKKHLPIYISAKETHSKVFPKYKNCHKGKEIVILAAGPTLDYYQALNNKLHLGINRSLMSNKANLDYIFIQDYASDMQEAVDNYKGNNCKKFYGIHHLVPGIAQSHADKANAERYYFIDCDFNSFWPYPPDISILPFNTYSSVVHPAITFALWTGVSKIYLVGCDNNHNGYANSIPKNYSADRYLHVDNILYGWKKIKEYAEQYYPETEIISINPVGLTGLFKDIYTKNYIEAHPELNTKNIEII